jgi:cytoskeletal protein RodZ
MNDAREQRVRALKDARLRQGWTVAEVARRCDLSPGVIRALESAAFADVAPPDVIDDYLHRYAHALEKDRTLFAVQDPISPTVSTAPHRHEIPAPAVIPRQSRGRYRWVMVGFLLLLLAILAILYWGQGPPLVRRGEVAMPPPASPDSPRDDEPAGAPELEVVSRQAPPAGAVDEEDQAPHETEHATAMAEVAEERPGTSGEREGERLDEPVAAVGEPAPAASPQALRHRLVIEAVQKTWVQVRVGRSKPESALLRAGEKRFWEVAEEVLLIIGNGGGVRVWWDDRELGPLGKAGDVLRVRLPDPKRLPE